MTKVLTWYFDKWWPPVLFFGLSFFLLVVAGFLFDSTIQNLLFYLFAFGFLGMLISVIYHLVKKRWGFAVLNAIITAVSVLVFFFYAVFMSFKAQLEPDTYADNLKIPANLKIHEPLEEMPDTIADTDFFLFKAFQPGLYHYAFWTKRIDKGKIYLKAFEVTQNDPLSAESLKESSAILVHNPDDSLRIFRTDEENSGYTHAITIYEGDWGKPYAARFEVWFVPDKGGEERKLMEKNYKIEGWQH